MDKTTKELRARLRAILSNWLQSDVVLYRVMRSEEESDALDTLRHRGEPVPESALGRRIAALAESDPDRIARVFLHRLADSDEIGLIVSQIGERRPLKRISASLIGEEPSESWVVCRPGLTTPSLPQELRSMTTLIDLMAEAIVPEWIDYLAEDAPDPDGLTPDARAFLKAMLELKLEDGKRVPQDCIWSKVAEIGDAIEGKARREAVTRILKDRKIIDTLSGTGTTLTTQGAAIARSMSSRSNPE